jgi:hypothetical protein
MKSLRPSLHATDEEIRISLLLYANFEIIDHLNQV